MTTKNEQYTDWDVIKRLKGEEIFKNARERLKDEAVSFHLSPGWGGSYMLTTRAGGHVHRRKDKKGIRRDIGEEKVLTLTLCFVAVVFQMCLMHTFLFKSVLPADPHLTRHLWSVLFCLSFNEIVNTSTNFAYSDTDIRVPFFHFIQYTLPFRNCPTWF